jgi:prolyl-tRNA synthetase
MKNFVTGANEPDAHYTGTNPGRDFDPGRVTDLRVAAAGDPCPRCEGTLQLTRGIEVGHVFKLGTKYSKAMRATYLDADGKEQLIVMGCYGIGTGRTVAAAIEQNHDENGISWPVPLAPFPVYLLPINVSDEKNRAAAEKLYADLQTAGLEALYDDRVERPGVKFKDADLLGIPLRIVVGEKTLAKDSVEFKLRRQKEVRLVKLEDALAQARQNLNLT